MARWDPYSLKKPCKNCPFLKDQEAAIDLAPGRVEGIINGLVNGPDTGFSCHKSVYSKHGGEWVEDPDSEDGERYQQSGNEKQCAGSLIVLQKLGKETQLMQVMRRIGQYNPDDFKPYHDLVMNPEDLMSQVTQHQIENAMSREQIVAALEAGGFQCYDSESKGALAYALAEHCNTEGLSLEDLNL